MENGGLCKDAGGVCVFPHSLRTDWLLYPVSHPPPSFPGAKASLCEVQRTGDSFEVLLPNVLNV